MEVKRFDTAPEARAHSKVYPDVKCLLPKEYFYLNGKLHNKSGVICGRAPIMDEVEFYELMLKMYSYFTDTLIDAKVLNERYSILQFLNLCNMEGRAHKLHENSIIQGLRSYPDYADMYNAVKAICEQRIVDKGWSRDGFQMARLILGTSYDYTEKKSIRTENTNITRIEDSTDLAKKSVEELRTLFTESIKAP